jgi:hypothetical protein
MPEKIIAFVLSVLLALSAAAQDEATDEDAGPDAADAQQLEDEAGSENEEDEEELDDADLDEQTYEEDDDDFVPTEEIRADEAIPFPTDI